jgi:hypothetical protein
MALVTLSGPDDQAAIGTATAGATRAGGAQVCTHSI